MSISEHATTFAGLPVQTFDPDARKSRRKCAYRVGGVDHVKSANNDDGYEYPDLLDRFLTQHGGKDLTALVVGAWDYDTMFEDGGAEVVEALVANHARMPNLRALFFGDVTFDECEISWLHPGDLSPLLPAFPKLEELRVRGVGALTFGKLKHGKLTSLALESGGLPDHVLREVWEADLPKLTHLELWLGSPSYGGISDPQPLEPLLGGKRFKKLKALGLRNCEIADAVAKAVAEAPVLGRLETLDLSLGNLTDAGAEALLRSPAVRKLKRLDLHHHFLSPPFVKALTELPLDVDVGDPQEPYFSSYGDYTNVHRFIVASE